MLLQQGPGSIREECYCSTEYEVVCEPLAEDEPFFVAPRMLQNTSDLLFDVTDYEGGPGQWILDSHLQFVDKRSDIFLFAKFPAR